MVGIKKLTSTGLTAALAIALARSGSMAQAPESWSVASVPRVSIGALDGPEEDILVNVLMGTVLSDGTIVLRNGISGLFELRYYDTTGAHLRTASHWGEGPYEFKFPYGVFRLPGDSIVVAGEDDRFAVFGPRGERVRDGRMGLGATLAASGSLALDSTRLLLQAYRGPRVPSPGTHRSESVLFAFDLRTELLDSLAVILGRPTHFEVLNSSGTMGIYQVPFSSRTFVAAGGGVAWVGDSQTDSIRGYRLGGSAPGVTIHVPFEAREVSRPDRSRARDAYGSLFSGETQQRWARYARTMEFPERMPWYGDLKVDVTGNVWVQEYEPFWSEGDQRWAVFSPTGHQVAEVTMPPSALPSCARRPAFPCTHLGGVLEIGAGYLIVSQSDDLGVRYVRQFDILKPRSPAF